MYIHGWANTFFYIKSSKNWNHCVRKSLFLEWTHNKRSEDICIRFSLVKNWKKCDKKQIMLKPGVLEGCVVWMWSISLSSKYPLVADCSWVLRNHTHITHIMEVSLATNWPCWLKQCGIFLSLIHVKSSCFLNLRSLARIWSFLSTEADDNPSPSWCHIISGLL